MSVEIIPNLTVSIDFSAAEDVDVVAADLQECGGILEDLAEGVGLPVGGVVGEFYVALDV